MNQDNQHQAEYHSTTKTIMIPVLVTYDEVTQTLLAYEQVDENQIASILSSKLNK